MNKPQKHSLEAYDYNEVIEYIEKKYNIQTRKRGEDFWHWLLDNAFYEMSNGCYQNLYVLELMRNLGEDDWQYDILRLIYDEYQEDEMEFYVWW